jgi:hypothetical protein
MKDIFNTALCRKARLAFLPAFLFVLASLPFAPAAMAGNPSDDFVSIPSSDLLKETELGSNRGEGSTVTTITVMSNQTMESTSTGNTLNVSGNLTNGPIYVGDNFGGTGFGSYVMNTGNNSVINSGVSLSVLMME